MQLRTLSVAALVFATVAIAPGDMQAGPRVRKQNCTPEASHNIDAALGFLNDHLGHLQNAPVSFARRRPKRRRIKRRMGRRLNRQRYDCATNHVCPANGWLNGQHYGGVMRGKVRLCYENMVNKGFQFCDFVGVLAHEFGHVAGIEIDGNHNNPAADKTHDPVYQFGNYAVKLCKDAGRQRKLNSPWLRYSKRN